MPVGGLSREQLLGGAWGDDRKANRAAAAIFGRILFMRYETRSAIEAFLTDSFSDYSRRLDRNYLESIRRQAQGEIAVRPVDFERYVSQWEALVPRDAGTRQALAEVLKRRHGIDAGTCPATMAALGSEETGRAGRRSGGEAEQTQDESLIDHAEASAEWIVVQAGEFLYRAGDRDAAMYLVVSGRIIETEAEGDGVAGTYGRGHTVGIAEVMTGEARTTNVGAARDSELVRLPQSLVLDLARRDTSLLMQVNEHLAERLRERVEHDARAAEHRTVVHVPLDEHFDMSAVLVPLSDELRRFGSVVRMTPADARERVTVFGIEAGSGEGVDAPEFVEWLTELETRERFVLMEAEPGLTSWTRRALRHADRVVFCVAADSPIPADGMLRELREASPHARFELLLTYPEGTYMPSGTMRWLHAVPVDWHVNLRRGDAAQIRRLARLYAGRGVGLVLSSGGARGYAHAGVIRRLFEAGVPIDVVGGSSIGSLVGGGFALGMAPEELEGRLRSHASKKAIFDFTLPVVSFLRGRKVTGILLRAFGRARIEDMWSRYFCVSTNLTTARVVEHRDGPLWRAVRASIAIPGAFSPVSNEAGDLLVDGGLTDSLPVELMRAEPGIGTVIASNTAPILEMEHQFTMGSSLSGWRLGMERLMPWGGRTDVPPLFEILMRANEVRGARQVADLEADLMIEPPVKGYPLLDFSLGSELIDFGYASTRNVIDEWLDSLRESGGLPWEGNRDDNSDG